MAATNFPILGYFDIEGNPLANGYLLINLSQDATLGSVAIYAGTVLNVPLSDSGVISTSPLFYPNAELTPNNTFYVLRAYSATGQLVLGPVYVTVTSGSPGVPVFEVYTLDLSPSVGGNFTVAHGLSSAPTAVVIEMNSNGNIWFQTVPYDATNLYLVASDGPITGIAKMFL